MHRLDLDQFRTTLETGGILSVSLVGQGGTFHVQAETRRGDAVLTKSRSTTMREFRNLQRAVLMLRELGVSEFAIDTKNWRPEQADIGRTSRPDRTAQMKAAHEAAELKRTLDASIREAEDPNTVWKSHDQTFSELNARYAD
jgi:hypothetical protein